jgi:RNA polymerase sigma-70 factor (ECF subfamily)
MGKELAVVQQAIAGNADAQDYLFASHAGRLYRTAFAVLHNKEDAEDALQDGMCKAYTSLRSLFDCGQSGNRALGGQVDS